MYQMDIQVRYSETGRFGKVRPHQILEYFQDCGTFQSISLGFGLRGDLDDESGRTWYLLAWDVHIKRYPEICEKITVITEPYKMRGFYGYRRYRILSENQEVIADADSLWIFMDLEKNIPVKIPDYLTRGYIPEKVDQTIRVKRKLSADGEWKEAETITVSRIYLDSNMHVNNANYVLWAEDLLPEGYEVKEVKVDYRQSTFLNDSIHVYTIKEEDKWRIKFENQKGVLAALVEMRGEQKEQTL